MKLDNRIQEKLNERKWYHRLTAITLVLSLLCAFFVPLDLVKPGFAETGETETTSDAFTDASADAPTGALDLRTFITNLTIGNQNAVQVTADGTPYQLDVNLNYVISQSAMENAEITDIVNGIPTHPYLTYLISSSDFSLNRDQQYGETCTVMDGSRLAGYYSLKKINDTSARLNIRLTKDYIEYLSQQTNGCTGSVGIGGNVDRASSESGDKDITIAGQTIHVVFPDTELGLNKSALGYQDGKIRWQIELTNPDGYIDLSTVTLEDVLKAGNDDTNIAGGKLSGLVTEPAGIFTLDSATGRMTYSGGDDNKHLESVKLTYEQSSPTDNVEYKNKVDAAWSTNKTKSSNEATFTKENKLRVTKSGVADYENGETMHNVMYWTVTVGDQNGDSLNGVTVTDTIPFPSDVVIKDGNGASVESTYYTRNDNGTITFNEGAPANVVITYSSTVDMTGIAVNSEKTVENTATAHSSRTDNPPGDGTFTAYPKYKHSLILNKSDGGGLTSNANELIQWRVEAKLDYGANSITSLNGYKITDSAFIDRNVDTSGTASENITYNAYDKDGNPVSKDVVTLTKDANSDTLTINVSDNTVVTRVVLFYNQSFENATYSKGNYSDYKIGNRDVTMTNTASAQNSDGTVQSGNVTGTHDAKIKADSWKNYVSGEIVNEDTDNEPLPQNNPRETVIGDEDQRIRLLNWETYITRDVGIDKTIGSLTDVIQPGDTERTDLHYITPEQASNITVSVSSDNGATWTPLESKDYEIIFYSKNLKSDYYWDNGLKQNENSDRADYIIQNFKNQTEQNALSFEVKFTSETSVGTYAKIEYQTTANVANVEGGTTTAFNNFSYTPDNTYEHTTTGLTFTREKIDEVKNFKLKLKKTWYDGNNYKHTRPETLTYQIWRTTVDPALATEQDWEQYKDDNEQSTFTMSVNATDQDTYSEGVDVPQWEYEMVDNKLVAKRYYYKIVEVETDSYTQVQSDEWVYANDNTEKSFTISNQLDSVSEKTAIDSTGKRVYSYTYSQIPTETINGVECYVFRWRIDDYIPKGGSRTYKDTVPSSSKMLTGNDSYKIRLGFDGNYEKDLDNNTVTAVQSDNTITFTVNNLESNNSNLRWFSYYTYIPVSSFENSLDNGQYVNMIFKNEETPARGYVTIREDEPEEAAKLTKYYKDSGARGLISYYLDVNPDGKNLSNGDLVDITDRMRLTSGQSGIKLALESVSVYPLVNGSKDSANPLTNVNYTIEYDVEDERDITIAKINDAQGQNQWELTGWEKGDKLTVTVSQNGDNQIDNGNNKVAIVFVSEEANGWSDGRNTTVNFSSFRDRTSVVQTTIPNNCTNIYLFDWSWAGAVADVTAECKSTPIPAVLNLSVPDEQPLRIEYNYSVSGYKEYTVDTTHYSGDKPYYLFTGLTAGEKVTALIGKTTTGKTMSDDVYYCFLGENETIDNATFDASRLFPAADAKGFSKLSSLEVPQGKTKLVIVDRSNDLGQTQPSIMNAYLAPSVVFSNEAALEADNGNENSTSDGNEMSVAYSTATISANNHPKIFKTDINDYSINTLAAKFKVARWDGTNWVYAKSITTITPTGAGAYQQIVFPTNSTGYLETEHSVSGTGNVAPTGSATLEFTQNSVHDFKFSLENEEETADNSAGLYKFVEIEAPTDYVQPRWDEGGMILNEPFVFYYAYNGFDMDTAPSDIASKVNIIPDNGTFNILNSKRITINAEKSFSGETVPNQSKVILKLYYSYKKNGTDKQEVTTSFLDLTAKEMVRILEKRLQSMSIENVISGYESKTDSEKITALQELLHTNSPEVRYLGSTEYAALDDDAAKVAALETRIVDRHYDTSFLNSTEYKSKSSSEKLGVLEAIINGYDTNPDTSFLVNPQTVLYSSGSSPTASWGGLPSGKNGKQIYYFVEEQSFEETVGGNVTVFTYDPATGTYKSGDDTSNFKPVYVGNGVNRNDATIVVNNSEGILVRKVWVDSSGKPIDPPVDLNGFNGRKNIQYEVYVYKNGARAKLDLTGRDTLTYNTDSTKSYRLYLKDPVTLTDVLEEDYTVFGYIEGKEYSLSDFDSYEIKELTAMDDDFLPYKTDRSIRDGTGYLEIINTRRVYTNAIAEKQWGDGAERHSTDNVSVKLYQTTTKLKANQLTTSNLTDTAIQSGNGIAVVNLDANDTRTTTYHVDTTKTLSSVSVEASDLATVNYSATTGGYDLTITGGKEGIGVVTLTYADSTTDTFGLTVLKRTATLRTSNSWRKEWTGLPTKTDAGVLYYYYVLESDVDGYVASYELKNQSTIITNQRDTDITVTKDWDLTVLPTGQRAAYQQSAQVELQRSTDGENWTAVGNAVTLDADNEWTYHYTYLDDKDDENKVYQYRVVEKAINGNTVSENASSACGFSISYENNGVKLTDTPKPTLTVKNTLLDGEIKIRKAWNLKGQTVDLPTEINVKVKDQFGTEYPQILVLSEAAKENQEYIWEVKHLPMYRADGTQLSYSVVEEPLSNFLPSYDWYPRPAKTENPDQLKITNTYVHMTDLTVQKDWDDGQDPETHLQDKLYIKVNRLTEAPSTATDLLLYANTDHATVYTGDDVTIPLSKAVSASNITVTGVAATAEPSGNGIKISGESEGTATVTIREGKDTVTISVTVTAPMAATQSSVSVPVGGAVSVNVNRDSVTADSNSNVNVTASGGTLTLKGLTTGATTLTVTNQDNTDETCEIAVTVVPGITITKNQPEGDTVEPETGTVQFTVNVPDGITPSVTITDPNGVAVTPTVNGNLYSFPAGEDEGNYTITATATIEGVPCQADLTVECRDTSGVFKVAAYNSSGDKINKVKVNEEFTVRATNGPIGNIWRTDYKNNITVVYADDKNSATISVSNADGEVEFGLQGGPNNNQNAYLTIEIVENLKFINAPTTGNPGNDVVVKTNLSAAFTVNGLSDGQYTSTLSEDGKTFTIHLNDDVAIGTEFTVTASAEGETNVTTETIKVKEDSGNELIITNYNSGAKYNISEFAYVNGQDKKLPNQLKVYLNGTSTNYNVTIYDDDFVFSWGKQSSASENTKSYTVVDGNTVLTVDTSWWLNSIVSMPNASICFENWDSSKVERIEFIYPEAASGNSQTQGASVQKVGAGLSASALSKTLKMKASAKSNKAIVQVYSSGPSTIKMDATFDADGYQIYEVKYTDTIGSDHFAKVISNLLSADANDNPYYYTVEELLIGDKSPSNLGYSTAYKFLDGDGTTWNSINATNAGASSVLIRNSKSTDTSVELPESGSTGTRIYYTIGAMLLLLAAAGYWAYSIKRRRWYDE